MWSGNCKDNKTFSLKTMIDERFVIIGAFLSMIGQLTYAIDTVKGKIKPNRVTWFLWALIPLIAFVAEIK